MPFEYFRVNTKTEKLNLKIDVLLKKRVSLKIIYSDSVSSAKSERKGLDELLDKLR